MKRRAPAALRNRAPITAVLRDELPEAGLVFEIASGTGEHAVHFARAFPALDWQPSDCDPQALASIAAWREELADNGDTSNLRPPIKLDVRSVEWPPLPGLAAMIAINLVHISPPETAEALLRGAGRLLPAGAPLVLYGPYLEEGVDPAPSNLAFDRTLRARDHRWGLRNVGWMDTLGEANGLRRTLRVEMPANNLVLVYRKND